VRRLRELAKNPRKKKSEEPGEEGSGEQPGEGVLDQLWQESARAPEEAPVGDETGAEAGGEAAPKGAGPQESVENLKKALDEMTRLAAQYFDRLKYLQADFDNYKKWAERDKAEFTKVANQRLVLAILPAIDNLEKALTTGKKGEKTPFVEGIELIYKELMETLTGVGLKPITAVGTKFDPYRHEALLCETRSDAEEGMITEELQKGYTLNDRVIRTSKVKIVKVPEPGGNADECSEPQPDNNNGEKENGEKEDGG